MRRVRRRLEVIAASVLFLTLLTSSAAAQTHSAPEKEDADVADISEFLDMADASSGASPTTSLNANAQSFGAGTKPFPISPAAVNYSPTALSGHRYGVPAATAFSPPNPRPAGAKLPKPPDAKAPGNSKPGRPAFIEKLRPSEVLQRDPQEVAAWWNELTPEERSALLEQDPKLIGGMAGVPTEVRDLANREALRREIEKARAALPAAEAKLAQAKKDLVTNQGRPRAANLPVGALGDATAVKALTEAQFELAAARRRLSGAMNLEKQLEAVTADPANSLKRSDVYLLDFDASFASGDGRAVVAFGDPSKAKHVGVVVPGIMNSLKTVQNPLQNAADLRTTARRVSGAADSATIMWLGYDTPNGLVRAPTKGMAKQGAPALKAFVDELRTTHRRPQPPKITVFGHSYGSTTTGLAGKMGMDADEIVLLGSPGAGSMRASQLQTRSGRVWAARTEDDIIKFGTHTAKLGADPMTKRYGAKIVPLSPSQSGHSGYYEFNSKGLANFARIMTGRSDEVR